MANSGEELSDSIRSYGSEVGAAISHACTLALEDKDCGGIVHPEHLLIALIERSANVQSLLQHQEVDPGKVVAPLMFSLDSLAEQYGDIDTAGVPIFHPDVTDILAHFQRRADEYGVHGAQQPNAIDLLHSFFLIPESVCVSILEDHMISRETVEFYLNWNPERMPMTESELNGHGAFVIVNNWEAPYEVPYDVIDTSINFETFGENTDDTDIELSTSRALVPVNEANKPSPKEGKSKKQESKMENGSKAANKTSTKTKEGKEEHGEALAAYTIDLTEMAADGKLDPIISADEQVDRAIQILSRKTKNNAIFTGPAGVGKTARIEHLAQRINDGDVPPSLENATIAMLDMNALIAGTTLRGQFEERLQGLIEDVIWYQENVGPIMLGIDEIHTIVGAGKSSGPDAANIFKPYMARGQINVIGGTTVDEYKKYIQGDKALDRRFQRVDVEEATPEEALRILKGRQASLEEYHGVKYSQAALKEMVRIATRFMRYRALPDSAIDLMDEAGAMLAVTKKVDTVPTVNVQAVRKSAAKATKIPYDHLNQDDGETLKNLGPDLKKVIYDQDDAIDSLVRAYKRSRAGVRPPNKTIGSFFFPGPSGSGKTETAKQLASKLNIPLVRIDMSEYMERHSVGRLIGSPKGYEGSQSGGQLTNAVRENPYSVVLLDEVEKAHPDVLNILLQLMDNGKVTDGWGNEVDFSNTVIIMTSNVGAHKKSNPIGFHTENNKAEEGKWDGEEELRQTFLREFLNRVDEVIGFNALKESTMPKIVMREIHEMEARLENMHDKGFVIDIDQETLDYLSKAGHDPANGARPLQRLIERQIGDPLSDEILGGQLRKGGITTISFNGEAAGDQDIKLKDKAPALNFDFAKVTKTKARQLRAARPAFV